MRYISMMYDRETLDKLKNVCRESEYIQIVGYDELFGKLKSYVDKDLENARNKKSKEDVDRIEEYFKWLIDWMNDALRSHAEYLLKKGIVMNMFDKIKGLSAKMEDMFSEEKLNSDLEKLQEDIKKRSEYYARENGENE